MGQGCSIELERVVGGSPRPADVLPASLFVLRESGDGARVLWAPLLGPSSTCQQPRSLSETARVVPGPQHLPEACPLLPSGLTRSPEHEAQKPAFFL